MSVAVQIWVEKGYDFRSIEVPNIRPRGRQIKHLSFAHREVLLVLARHARHNGLTWPGMPLIATEAGVSEGQARRLVNDLRRADLVKVHGGGGRHHSNYYWVRVPWVEEPACVMELPKLDNKQYPAGARLKLDDQGHGRVKGIDVDYYVRLATIKTLAPAPGFSEECPPDVRDVMPLRPGDRETPAPAPGNVGETPAPAHPNRAETLAPAPGEPPSYVEPPSLRESLSAAATRGRAREGFQDEKDDRIVCVANNSVPNGRATTEGGQRTANGHDVALAGFAVAPLPTRVVEQKPRFRCVKCRAWQDEPPRLECKNPMWHDHPESQELMRNGRSTGATQSDVDDMRRVSEVI